jgi:hypothetical protein
MRVSDLSQALWAIPAGCVKFILEASYLQRRKLIFFFFPPLVNESPLQKMPS